MSSSPTRDQLAVVLDTLASRLATLEAVMASFPVAYPPAVTIGHAFTNVVEGFHNPLPKKKGKGKTVPPPTPRQPPAPLPFPRPLKPRAQLPCLLLSGCPLPSH